MTHGLEKTQHTLATTRNRAVLPLLAAGLRSPSAAVRAAVINAAVRRTDRESHAQLIRHFATFGEAEQGVFAAAYRAMPHHAAPALQAALAGRSAKLCRNACQIILLCQDFDAFPMLLAAAHDRESPRAARLAATACRLAELLGEQSSRPAPGRAAVDPIFIRHRMLAALEKLLTHDGSSVAQEIAESFLLLAPADHPLLQRILRESSHPAHAAMLELLATSDRPTVFERLIEMLHDTDAPQAALLAVAARRDHAFVAHLLKQLRRPVPLRVLHNMKRLQSVAWLESHREMLLDVDGRCQAVAVELAAVSGLEEDSIFDLLAMLAREGLSEGRRAACQALGKFDGPTADLLVLAVLDDPDAAVQSAAVRQLRPRRMPQALQVLVSLLDSPSGEVRDAARSSLAEFNFVRYRAMFDLLDEQTVRTTGVLVHKVDASAVEGLLEELASPSVSARLRGIEMAIAMEATQDVCAKLIELAGHENLQIRAAALDALADCRGEPIGELLEAAAGDANQLVAAAARRSLTRHQQSAAAMLENRSAAVGGAT